MKARDVQIGKRYIIRIGQRIVPVRILGESPYGGWSAKNERTGRIIRIRSARRLRGEWSDQAAAQEWMKAWIADVKRVRGETN